MYWHPKTEIPDWSAVKLQLSRLTRMTENYYLSDYHEDICVFFEDSAKLVPFLNENDFRKTGIVNTATNIIGILNERDKAKAEQRRHEMEMALKTETLCDQICVTEWTHWTPCTARCGGGVKRREREHILPGRCKSVSTTVNFFLD